MRETHRKVARTVSNVLALMDEDPDFTYAMSSAQQYAWLEQEHPDLFARMLQRIKEGRFIPVGGMWVESDNMLPTGESLIRQITFGMRYFREHLGVEPKGLWLPDSFGYCGGMAANRTSCRFRMVPHTEDLMERHHEIPPPFLRMGLNQFHDILPGSAIAWVHRQARADYVRDIARLRDIAAEAGASIASARDDADMRSNAAIVPYAAKNGDSWIARTAAVGTQDDDANGTDAVADESTIATTCDDGRIILDNGLLRAIIAPDGTVRSLIDLDNGHELVPDGSGIGHYELLRDEPYEWDAWDIQRDAFLSAEGIDDSHVERVTETKRGGATVHVSSTTDGVSIDACITLRAKSKSLEFRTKVDWRASERFLKVDIPMAIQADRAQYECQYGMVERPIQKNTRSDEAKYESCTHRFVRVADAGYAAAVVNASTYGSDVSPIHRNTASGPVRGTMIRLSLLSSPLYPDPNTDKGVHEFAWNVVADASMPAVLDEANRLNAAVLPAMPAFDPLAQLNPVDGVMVLDWVKLADDGSGDLILRVYEAVGGEAHARLAVNAALGKATVRECSIMEDARLDAELPAAFADGDPSVARTAQGAMLSLHPFQLATLRVSCGSDGGNTDGNESGSLR